MQRIRLDQAAEGMIVARPIESANGQVLCNKGTKLTESLIARLRRLDISRLTVEGRPVDDDRPRKTLEEELAELDRRFASVQDNKIMLALKAVVQKYIRNRHEQVAQEETEEAARQAEAEASTENQGGN